MHALTRNDAAALTLNDRQDPRFLDAVTAGGSPPSELDRSAGATGASSRGVLNVYVCVEGKVLPHPGRCRPATADHQ